MSHLNTPMMKWMYPQGYPREKFSKTCGERQPMGPQGAICIIDNKHPGRPHWGPDSEGVFRQWVTDSGSSSGAVSSGSSSLPVQR